MSNVKLQNSTSMDLMFSENDFRVFGLHGANAKAQPNRHRAEQGGRPVTFTPNEDIEVTEVGDTTIDITGIDLKRPPGFVGEVTAFINSQCRYPRENLAVAAALTSVGNIVGLRYADAVQDVTTNVFAFCVAGSGTGKEAIQQAALAIHRAARINAAVHGNIKSEQEILRNLTDHQAAYYIIDEIGIMLKKIKNAQQKGGAAYLDGVIGMLMSVYSKANGWLPVTGDIGPVTVLFRFFDDLLCNKGETAWDATDQKNSARMRLE